MAENSANTPIYEYSKVDVSFILVFHDGFELPLANRWEEATFSPSPQAGTMKGSGRFPRAHIATRYEPEFSIIVDKDMADYIIKRKGNRAIKAVKAIRQRPEDAPITDFFKSWNPSYGETAFNDDATAVELTGMLLGFELDKQNKISVTA
jgi:hypothetical protein